MMRSLGPLQALAGTGPAWDASGAPRSSQYDDGYHGSVDAIGESEYVFLAGSGVASRLATYPAHRPFTVAELGFGTGLNFLLTWRTWREVRRGRLHYLGVDRHPLRTADMARALARHPVLAPLAAPLCDALPPPVAGVHRIGFDGGRVILDLYWADAADALAELDSLATPLVDAWYLDGFAPSRNPAMWTPALFAAMARSSRDGATVATYSAAGQVRRDLDGAGFHMRRRPGFGSKRECLQGELRQRPAPAAPRLTPWDLPAATPPIRENDRRAIVLGAGLAGAHAAAALARRGWQVTVLDAADVASGASGNDQGLLFTRLSHQHSTLGDFSLAAFHFSARLYADLFARGELRAGCDGDLSGCFQVVDDESGVVAAALAALPELAVAADGEAASRYLGLRVARGGFWQPGSGWLSPPAVCRALLRHPAITLKAGCGALRLQRQRDLWTAVDGTGTLRAEAPVAIVAAGTACRALLPDVDLPLRPVRGQTTRLPAPPGPPLRHALSHRGYIAPAVDGWHCIGATFRPGDATREPCATENAENLATLAEALPDWQAHLATLDAGALTGRAEVRCVSPDYLPLVGAVPDGGALRACFAGLRRDARRVVDARAPVQPGLWLTTAHGSRGLSYAALAGELIASAIGREAPPLPRELSRAVSPARFAIRAIVRGDDTKEIA